MMITVLIIVESRLGCIVFKIKLLPHFLLVNRKKKITVFQVKLLAHFVLFSRKKILHIAQRFLNKGKQHESYAQNELHNYFPYLPTRWGERERVANLVFIFI